MPQAILSVDLAAVVANWRELDRLSGPGVETAAVVKADAYGLGAAAVGRALAGAGARTFFVAQTAEGVALRTALGPDAAIFVFEGHGTGDAHAIRGAALTPLINTPEQWARHAEAAPGHPFGVQLDTGMNRLGIEPADWAALRDRAIAAGPAAIVSHLACADEPHHPMNGTQLATFRSMTEGVCARRSLAATGGTLLGPGYHFDLVRPGIGLYGGLPFRGALPVVGLEVPVIQTRSLVPGETVGYGAAWRAEGHRRIATLSAGYADGLIRAMGGRARAWAGDVPCPVVGRVSMDLLTVDVTALDEVPPTMALLGPHQGVDDLADAGGTIGYEILTALGRRYDRRVVGADAAASVERGRRTA